MEEKIFGMTMEEISKLVGSLEDEYDSNNPIVPEQTLEPCLEGAKSIISDPEQKKMFNRIYWG